MEVTITQNELLVLKALFTEFESEEPLIRLADPRTVGELFDAVGLPKDVSGVEIGLGLFRKGLLIITGGQGTDDDLNAFINREKLLIALGKKEHKNPDFQEFYNVLLEAA